MRSRTSRAGLALVGHMQVAVGTREPAEAELANAVTSAMVMH